VAGVRGTHLNGHGQNSTQNWSSILGCQKTTPMAFCFINLYLSAPKCGNSISGWWFQPPLKYIYQIGSSSQLLGKIKFMFQTTNQISCVSCLLLSTDFLTLCGLLGPVLLLHWSAPSHRCALMLSKGLKDTGT